MTQPKRPALSLELIQITTPCSASWEAMRGDDRVRFCEQCKLNVYDISAMSRREASDLVASREGRLCVQMFRRADGMVITDDCSAIRKAARRAGQFATSAASVVLCAALSPIFLMSSDRLSPPRSARASFMPMAMFESWIVPMSRWFSINRTRGEMSIAGGITAPPTTQPIMGDVAMPPTTQPAQPLKGKISPSTQPAADEIDHTR